MYEAGAISEQRSHFRIRWPQTLVVLKHRLDAGRRVDERINHIPDHDRPLTAGVICPAVFNAFGEPRSHECRSRVRNECEIAHGRRVAHHDRGARRIERLSDSGADDRSFTLSWPERVEWTENTNRYDEHASE